MTRNTKSNFDETPNNNKRPENYLPQQWTKATLSLADFEDSQLFAELRRRGYTGELRFYKKVNV